MKTLEEQFLFLHNNPPPPFNPDYDPKAIKRSRRVTQSMEADNYYANHSREECREEWHGRYERSKNNV